ncbi:MAG: hypothetical protein WCH39_08410 [Schlesneria sp.]
MSINAQTALGLFAEGYTMVKARFQKVASLLTMAAAGMSGVALLMLIDAGTAGISMVSAADTVSGKDWTPPENPDPQTILNEAKADAQAKRYEIALAKQVWFHENALSLNQAMTGVRLSFALANWESLGRVYPLALAKLQAIRDGLQERALKGEDLMSAFADLAAINRTLGEDFRTSEAFRALDALNPKVATMAIVYVKPALVKSKDYDLYLKYTDVKRDYLRMRQHYERNILMVEDKKIGPNLADFAKKSFRNGSATLVAILAVSDRKQEASDIASLAKKQLDDPEFHKELDAALTGTVPKAFP